MPLYHTNKNPLWVDLIPPFGKPELALYGTIAEVLAILFTILILFEFVSFTEPQRSITIALWLGAWYANYFER